MDNAIRNDERRIEARLQKNRGRGRPLADESAAGVAHRETSGLTPSESRRIMISSAQIVPTPTCRLSDVPAFDGAPISRLEILQGLE